MSFLEVTVEVLFSKRERFFGQVDKTTYESRILTRIQFWEEKEEAHFSINFITSALDVNHPSTLVSYCHDWSTTPPTYAPRKKTLLRAY